MACTLPKVVLTGAVTRMGVEAPELKVGDTWKMTDVTSLATSSLEPLRFCMYAAGGSKTVKHGIVISSGTNLVVGGAEP
jgi:hypothetical protein